MIWVERVRSLASTEGHGKKKRNELVKSKVRFKASPRWLVPDAITVQELVNRMAENADVIKKLMELGVMATINQVIDADTAELVTGNLVTGFVGYRIWCRNGLGWWIQRRAKNCLSPVVTIWGMSSWKNFAVRRHAKDRCCNWRSRGYNVPYRAYQIQLETTDKITFLDTPGTLRSRNACTWANVTDIIVLVVAADDGINDQTVEPLDTCGRMPNYRSINKIDLPDLTPRKSKPNFFNTR